MTAEKLRAEWLIHSCYKSSVCISKNASWHLEKWNFLHIFVDAIIKWSDFKEFVNFSLCILLLLFERERVAALYWKEHGIFDMFDIFFYTDIFVTYITDSLAFSFAWETCNVYLYYSSSVSHYMIFWLFCFAYTWLWNPDCSLPLWCLDSIYYKDLKDLCHLHFSLIFYIHIYLTKGPINI